MGVAGIDDLLHRREVLTAGAAGVGVGDGGGGGVDGPVPFAEGLEVGPFVADISGGEEEVCSELAFEGKIPGLGVIAAPILFEPSVGHG